MKKIDAKGYRFINGGGRGFLPKSSSDVIPIKNMKQTSRKEINDSIPIPRPKREGAKHVA